MLIAFEVFHYLKNKRLGRTRYFALKLDMSKAYDRVEWGFLEAVMVKMGFPLKFVGLVLNCVSSVSYSVLLNGKPTRCFRPSRGIRQGDPISPYLFLLCAEALSVLIRRAEEEGRFSGISISRGGPQISHLFFADDSLLFAKATDQSLHTVQTLLRTYELASGAKSQLRQIRY